MKKRTLSLLLAVACALSLALSGCGGAPAPDAQTSAPAGSETPAAVDQTREIVFAASRDQCPGEQDAYYASMSLGVWEPLITKDESGKPAPALATEWEHNEDSTVWTFHLREGVTFSNGTPFNADSVLANFDRMKKGPFESSFYGMNIDTIYPGLVSYEKTDDYTVVLTLSEGQPLLDYTMVNYGSAIFEPSCFAEDGTFAGFPIGTGPYVVTENVLGQYCVIERNDSYWGTPGIAKTFRFKVIPDAETRYTALRAGEVQGLCDLGAISPSPNYTPEVARRCMEEIFLPTVAALKAEGRPFQGVLYFGLMLTPDGPKVVEYNARFGDPECQAVLSLLETDLLDIFLACRNGTLDHLNIRWKDGAACCLVLASGGYPGSYAKGLPITGLEDAGQQAVVFHAGTKLGDDGTVFTNGGRASPPPGRI